MAGLPCSLLATATTGTGVGWGFVLADAPGRAAPATSDAFRQAVVRVIITSLSLLVPSSLSPFVPRPFVSWSFWGMLATRYPLLAGRLLDLNFQLKPERAARGRMPGFG